jgi:hypothetical protein
MVQPGVVLRSRLSAWFGHLAPPRPLPGHPPPPERLRRLYTLAAGAIGLALLVQAVPRLERGLANTHCDLDADRGTAMAFLDHYNPYTPEGAERSGVAAYGPSGNGHPPTTAFWFLPLAHMSLQQAAATLAWISVLALMMELTVTMTALRFPLPAVSSWLALGYVLGCSFMEYHVQVGQISCLIGVLLFLGWIAGRRQDDWLAGVAIGAACSMKAFPGVMVLMLVAGKRWRAVVGAVGTYLTIALVMTSRFGLASWGQFASKQKAIANLWLGSIQNQSIHGIVTHVIRPVCIYHGPVIAGATVVSVGLSALLLAFATWLVWPLLRTRDSDAPYALFVMLSTLTSQWSWEHYTVIYVLPVLILGAKLAAAAREREHRESAVAMLVLLGGVVASWRINLNTKSALQISMHQGHRKDHLMLHVYDVLYWAPGLVLLAMLFVVCGWERQALLDGAPTLLPRGLGSPSEGPPAAR